MLRSCEHADESPKDQLKASLRFLRRQLRHLPLLADDMFQFRHELDDELPVRIERLAERIAPCAQLVFALAQERPDEALKGLRQRGVWDVAFELVELA